MWHYRSLCVLCIRYSHTVNETCLRYFPVKVRQLNTHAECGRVRARVSESESACVTRRWFILENESSTVCLHYVGTFLSFSLALSECVSLAACLHCPSLHSSVQWCQYRWPFFYVTLANCNYTVHSLVYLSKIVIRHSPLSQVHLSTAICLCANEVKNLHVPTRAPEWCIVDELSFSFLYVLTPLTSWPRSCEYNERRVEPLVAPCHSAPASFLSLSAPRVACQVYPNGLFFLLLLPALLTRRTLCICFATHSSPAGKWEHLLSQTPLFMTLRTGHSPICALAEFTLSPSLRTIISSFSPSLIFKMCIIWNLIHLPSYHCCM